MGLQSVKNQCYQIWTYYISLVRKSNAEQFLQKKVHVESQYFEVYQRKTIFNYAITVK